MILWIVQSRALLRVMAIHRKWVSKKIGGPCSSGNCCGDDFGKGLSLVLLPTVSMVFVVDAIKPTHKSSTAR